MAPIFHLTTSAEWDAAQSAGSYTGSTRGRTLAEEGFIHCSRGDQWPRVRDQFYADLDESLVLLKIDPDRLDVPVVDEAAPGSEETFPHLYGPLPLAAVTQVIPLDSRPVSASSTTEDAGSTTAKPAVVARPREEEFGPIFLKEMFRNVVVLIVVCANVMGGAVIGHAIQDNGYGAIAGLLLGAAVGIPLAIVAKKQLSTEQ